SLVRPYSIPLSPSLFFNHPATSATSPLSLHDALPISSRRALTVLIESWSSACSVCVIVAMATESSCVCSCSIRMSAIICRCSTRSEEHTSELQSHLNLVCRLLLEKKKISKNNDN